MSRFAPVPRRGVAPPRSLSLILRARAGAPGVDWRQCPSTAGTPICRLTRLAALPSTELQALVANLLAEDGLDSSS